MFLSTEQGGLEISCVPIVVVLLEVVAYPFKNRNVTLNF